jgi:Protein of unknown function (DUF2523)
VTSLFAFLSAAIGPLVIRALLAVGFTSVTFAGVLAVVNQLVSSAQTSWSSLPLGVLQIASLCGVPEALGIVTAAFVARATLWVAASSSRLIFTGRS